MANLSGSNPMGSSNPINQGGTGGAFQVRETNAPASVFKGVSNVGQSISRGSSNAGAALIEGLMAKSLSKQQHYQDMEKADIEHGRTLELGDIAYKRQKKIIKAVGNQERETMRVGTEGDLARIETTARATAAVNRAGSQDRMAEGEAASRNIRRETKTASKATRKETAAQAAADVARERAAGSRERSATRQQTKSAGELAGLFEGKMNVTAGSGGVSISGKRKAEPTATAAMPAAKKPAATETLTPAQKAAATRKRNAEAAAKQGAKKPPRKQPKP